MPPEKAAGKNTQKCEFNAMAHISIGQTSKMCHRVGMSLNAGVDIMGVLQRESQHGPPAYRRNMTHVAEKVGRGTTLAEAMQDCGGYFPPLVSELVGVGEEAGRLESVLLRLADHYQHVIKLRRVFLLGIIWPSLQLFAALAIIGGLILLLGILGTSASVFGLSGGRGAAIYFGVVAVVLAGLALVVFGLSRNWFGTLPGRLILFIPGVGRAIKAMALARLSWTLSMGLESGVDAGRAMRLALQSTQNRHFTRHIPDVDGVIQRGGQFHEALEKTGAFPRDFLTSLQNAELSGTESESLSRMSEDYQKQAETASAALAVIFSMMIWGMVAALLIFMIFYLFMNLYMKPYQEALDFLENG